ncbi:YlbE-like family protein [Aeribacillus sp. FSL K6-1121]|uniref:YlbE-like family protein n=1 Tax=Aeribacillus TaxID=1055323 RepID=UPI000E37F089|nr:YlbE-like family protein [Aeribacillus composti]MDR9795506.1 YlbE-like family protein [Aeribacillus pallidus]REJ24148.1 MAG: hypothetical protein C6W54_08495 [Bacillaceae bacterium]TVZ83122.1 YlbE-like protein [Aeribacillus composti]
MRKDLYLYIQQNPLLKQYIREKPYWYRTLTRHPEFLEKMEISMANDYYLTLPHKIEKFSNSIQMMSMMLSMLQAFREN